MHAMLEDVSHKGKQNINVVTSDQVKTPEVEQYFRIVPIQIQGDNTKGPTWIFFKYKKNYCSVHISF